MRLISDASVALWLENFVPDPVNFDWDEGNASKNLKHGISSSEIESIFRGWAYVFVGKIIEPAHNEWRGLILGETSEGKHATLIFTRRGDRLRPISCRPMRADERRCYEEEKD